MANRYWVGGTADWDGTAGSKWATTSGGGGGAAVPTSSDDVFFDAASGAVTVTLVTAACRTAVFTGFTGTFAGSGSFPISGPTLTFGAGMTRTFTGNISLQSSGTLNVTCNGITLASLIICNGSSQTVVLQDALSTTGELRLLSGNLDTNGQTVTCGLFQFFNNTNTRTLTLGSSTFNCTEFRVAGSNQTINAGTSTIQSTNRLFIFTGAGFTYYNLTLSPTGTPVNLAMSGANTFNNLSLTAPANKTTVLSLANDIVVNGVFGMNGNSAINRVLVRSSVLGTARTITAATVTCTHLDLMDITGAGAGSWNLASITGNSGDCGGNSGITFTTPATQTWNGNGGNWSTSARWTSRVPLPQDDCVFDATSFTIGAQTVTGDMPRSGRSINWTGVTNTPAYNIGNIIKTIYGSLTLVSGMTIGAGTGQISFGGRSSYTLTSAGLSFVSGLTLEAPGGTLTLQDALSCGITNVLIVTHGTFDANDQNVTTGLVNISASTTRAVSMGNGTWSLTGVGNVWQATTTTGLTFNAESSLIQINNASASAKSFLGGSLTYSDFIFTGAGSGTLTIDGSNTFADFAIATAPKSVLFTAATTQTVATWSVEGSAGNLITINSTTTANFILAMASGIANSNYLSIANSDAGGGATWYAGANSTDAGGGNTGWIFTAAVIGITKQLQYAINLVTPVSITKQLQYAVGTPESYTKQLQYTVKAPAALTLALAYRVITSASVTKGLVYVVAVPTQESITKSLAYYVAVPTPVTKQLRYVVKAAHAVTLSLTYRMRPSYPYTRKTTNPYSSATSPYTRSAGPYTKLSP